VLDIKCSGSKNMIEIRDHKNPIKEAC